MKRISDREFLTRKRRPKYEEGVGEISVVDLFCGCGGMTLGIAHAASLWGLSTNVPLALDIDPDAVRVFMKNFPRANCVTSDVRSWFAGRLGSRLSIRERATRRRIGSKIDILLGGPPCQGNSDLNNYTRRRDPKNALYARMARAARVLQARWVIIENVPSVLHDIGGVVGRTIRALRKDGYQVFERVIDLRKVGLPQRRRRHLLLASLKSEPEPSCVIEAISARGDRSQRDLRWAIGDLRNRIGKSDFDTPSKANEVNAKRMRWLFENRKYDLPNSLRPACHRNCSHSYDSVYGRLRWNEPAQTITTGFGSMGQGRYVHPTQRRTITPHEAARLQTFPDFFSFEPASGRGAWARLIGNAVPPILTMRIGEALFQRGPP